MRRFDAALVLACAGFLTLAACGDSGETAGAGGSSSSVGGSSSSDGGSGLGGSGGVGVGGGADGGGGASCVNSLPALREAPATLSETGLYADLPAKEVASQVSSFVPRFTLWSDGADKQRWVYLPECDTIDTSDMNDWSLPVGTRLWKEFSLNGVRLETRLVMRTGPGAHDFVFTTYVWNDTETEATRSDVGVPNAKGTDHDIPGEPACRQCHGSHAKGGGRPSRALGLSALQLSGATTGLSLADLIAAGKLSAPPAADNFDAPGDAVQRAALGYLHVNCGPCHNASVDGVPQIDLNLWLDVEATSVEQTGAYQTAVGVPNAIFNVPGLSARVEPGQPQASAVWYRMSQRGNVAQMPPVGSEMVDTDGVAAVEAWIGAMP